MLLSYNEFIIAEQSSVNRQNDHKVVFKQVEPFDPSNGKGAFIVKVITKGEQNPQIVFNILVNDPGFQKYTQGLVNNGPWFYSYETLKDTDSRHKYAYKVTSKIDATTGKKKYADNTPLTVSSTDLPNFLTPEFKQDGVKLSIEKQVLDKALQKELVVPQEPINNVKPTVEPSTQVEPTANSSTPSISNKLELDIDLSYNPIKLNTHSLDVGKIQAALVKISKLPEKEVLPSGIDGFFGQETINLMNKLGIDGNIFDEAAYIKLISIADKLNINLSNNSTPVPTTTATTAAKPTLNLNNIQII